MANKDLQTQNENPVASHLSPFRDMERVMDRFFSDPFGSFFTGLPALSRRAVGNIEELDDGYLLTAEIPGIPAEGIDIQVSGNLLTVKAERKEEEGGRRQHRSFHQSFSLPSTIDAEKIEAHCENGMLEIFMPKTQASQAKRIEIQSGKGGAAQRLSTRVNETAQAKEGVKKH